MPWTCSFQCFTAPLARTAACKVCSSFYPLHSRLHAGKPSFGKDHVASTCTNEGRTFDEGENWWEWGVEALPAPAPAAAAAPAKA